MATILLDSSVIFDHLNDRHGRTEFLDGLVEEGHLLGCCEINIVEVYAGLRTGEESKTADFLDTLHFFPVTPRIAMRAGLMRRDGRLKGHVLSTTDTIIAAVAVGYHLPLLTDNRKHFPMSELTLHPLP